MALQLEKKVYAAFVAGVLAVGGPTVVWNNTTAKAETKKIVAAYQASIDSAVAVTNRSKVSHFQYKPDHRYYQPAEVIYRPCNYTIPSRVYRIEISDTTSDSVWYLAYLQSDSTGLLDVTARIEPTMPPDTGGK